MSVSDLMACLRLIGAWQEIVYFIGKDMSVEWLRLIGARTMLGKNVDVGVEVDLNVFAQCSSVA